MSDATRKGEETTWQRRGVFAAGAALVAAVVAKVTEQPIEAGSDGDVVLGNSNMETTETLILNTAADSTALEVACNGGTRGTGLFAFGSAYGVLGISSVANGGVGGAGVCGQNTRADSFGVQGINNVGVGVLGQSSTGTGVVGQTTSGLGVIGQIAGGANASSIAVYGANFSPFTGPSPGAGGFGVYGLSVRGHGLVGATATAGGAAVVGATNGVSGAYAAAFYGPVVVSGDFTVVGGAKSAAVPHPDGSHRRLYCVESPESWFEDFGEGQLAGGCATVAIDPDFAAVIDLTRYHVFVTGYDDFDLRVSERSPKGFRVVAKDAAASGRFSWRLVAKRKDIAGPRFESVTVPPEPTLPNMPPVPVPASPPIVRRQ